MIRRYVIIIMSVVMFLTCAAPAFASALTKAERYDAAVAELKDYLNDEGTMPLDDLFMAFSLLGSYEHSAMFAVYTNALRNVEKGEYSRVYYYISSLQVDEEFCTFLTEDGDFGSIGKLEAYARARQAEQDGDIAAALTWYKECSSFKDSFARMMALQDSQLADKYQQAMAYYLQDTYEGYQRAYELFLELAAYGGYENSEELMAMADILRVTPAPTATPAPTPIPTPVPTVAAKNVEYTVDHVFYGYGPRIAITWDVVEGVDEWSASWHSITNENEPLRTSSSGGNTGLRYEKGKWILGLRGFPVDHTYEFFIYPKGDSYDSPTSYRLEYTFSAPAVSKISSITVDEYAIDVYSDNTCVITDYTGNQSDVAIPSTLSGYVVTGVGDFAFSGCKSLMNISIPNSVQIIEESAFWYCSALESVDLPSSLVEIGDAAFGYCTALTSIAIPNSVVSIAGNPFVSCTNLREINVASNHPVLKVVDGVLFDVPQGILICYPDTRRGSMYDVPQGTRTIGRSAFRSCTSLASINLPLGLEKIGDDAFISCTSLTSINLPLGLEKIGDNAFQNCTSLQSISIPNSTVSIGTNPFAFCINLREINVAPNHPVLKVDNGVLFDVPQGRLICYPIALNRSMYEVPRGTHIIGEKAFAECDNLVSISLPDSVITVEDYAVIYCDSLTSLNIPASVTRLGLDLNNPISSCPNLTLYVQRDSDAHEWAQRTGLKNYVLQ